MTHTFMLPHAGHQTEKRDTEGAAQLALVVLALKDKDAGTYIDGGRDLTMIFEGGDL